MFYEEAKNAKALLGMEARATATQQGNVALTTTKGSTVALPRTKEHQPNTDPLHTLNVRAG